MISDIESKVDESESKICPPFPEYNDKVFFDVSHQQNLNSLAKQILKRKNGITLHELAFDIAKCHGMSRQSKKQRTHLLNIIKSWVGLIRDGIHRLAVWYSPKDIAEEIPWRGIAPWGQNRDWRKIPFPEAIGLAKAALEKAPDDPVNFICGVFELKKRHPGTLDEFHSWIKSASS